MGDKHLGPLTLLALSRLIRGLLPETTGYVLLTLNLETGDPDVVTDAPNVAIVKETLEMALAHLNDPDKHESILLPRTPGDLN